MFLTDDHLHTEFSIDGCETMESVCEAAIERGLSEIAITDHMDIFSDKPYGSILDCELWYEKLTQVREKYRGRLMVHRGIELGQPQSNPSEAKSFLDTYPLDFIIGSVHCMENDIDVYEYDFSKVDAATLCPHYVEWLKDLATGFDFDVMGHIIYPSRYMLERRGIHLDMMEYRDLYRELFELLIPSGRGIELNLSGLARGGGIAMPEMDLLKLYRECGGEIVTVGSDAHVTTQVGVVSAKGQEMLKEAGFKYIAYFEERKPQFIKL